MTGTKANNIKNNIKNGITTLFKVQVFNAEIISIIETANTVIVDVLKKIISFI